MGGGSSGLDSLSLSASCPLSGQRPLGRSLSTGPFLGPFLSVRAARSRAVSVYSPCPTVETLLLNSPPQPSPQGYGTPAAARNKGC